MVTSSRVFSLDPKKRSLVAFRAKVPRSPQRVPSLEPMSVPLVTVVPVTELAYGRKG